MIHVLGAGNIGSLLGVALARRSPVQFLLRPATLKNYSRLDSPVRIGIPNVSGAIWDANITAASKDTLSTPLEKLIVAVKSYQVRSALSEYRKFLTPKTEVLVVHNGMGVAHELEELWAEEEAPRLSFGVTNAGVKRISPDWLLEYTGGGVMAINGDGELVDSLVESKELVISEKVSPAEFERQQLSKLIVNAVINPLTAILGCPNGALLSLDKHYLIPQIVSESARILDMDRDRALDVVYDVIAKTSSNVSSMLADVEQGRPSEVDYINGYIIKQAQLNNKRAPLNMMLRDLVLMRTHQSRHELETFVPLKLD